MQSLFNHRQVKTSRFRRTARAVTDMILAIAIGIFLCLTPADGFAKDPPPEYYDGGAIDLYAHFFFWVNRQLFTVINAVSDALPGELAPAEHDESGIEPPQTELGRGIGNVASNLVNEPITAVTNFIMMDFATAWTAVQRFAINSTIGLFGWNDVARDWGLKPTVTDIGLLMCKEGVGEGGYVVLPLVGPRTVRDAAADIILTNVILWSFTALALGTGVGLRTIILAETIELAVDLFATRQIDPRAKVSHFDNFAAVRRSYLKQRRERCGSKD